MRVRAFGPRDGDALLGLYRGCLAHCGLAPAPAGVEAEILRELAAPYGTSAEVAWRDDRPAGFAFWLRIPAGQGFALYLKELFVAGDARGGGVGRALMRAMAERAAGLGARRLQWEAGDAPSRAFYAGLGAAESGKTHYAVQAADLDGFARATPFPTRPGPR